MDRKKHLISGLQNALGLRPRSKMLTPTPLPQYSAWEFMLKGDLSTGSQPSQAFRKEEKVACTCFQSVTIHVLK